MTILGCLAGPAAGETLYANFDQGKQWAQIAAGNPFPLGGGWEVTDDGALHIIERDGYLAFDATDNVPHERGVIAMRIDADDPAFWTDGERHCLFALSRSVTGIFGEPERRESAGLAMSLHKSERSTLDLVVHPGGVFLDFDQAEPLISVDASEYSSGERWVVVAWDWSQRRVGLVSPPDALPGECSAPIPAQLTRPWPYHMLVIGNTGVSSPFHQEPLGATIDELTVNTEDIETWMAGQENDIRFVRESPDPPLLCDEPTVFADDALLGRLERICRRNLEMLVRAQEQAGSGGWNLAVTWPSLMCVMGGKSRLPETDGYFLSSKDGNTSFGATFCAWGYEALGDARYLAAAEWTARMYLQTQAEGGWWINSYVYENGDYVPTKEFILLQDHAQTGPMRLPMYLHRLTGNEAYRDAAVRSADFMARAQNANGSRSYIYDPEQGCGLTAQRTPGGGEVNDYGTSGPIEALVHMWRLTGKREYRDAALRGADWLADVFINNGRVAGWAAQYNVENEPIPARHFEPASVAIYGARWAAPGLVAAYWETRDEKYLAPLRTVIAWLEKNEVEPGRWWNDYEVETGRPIEMWERKLYYMDDPEQVAGYTEVSGREPQTVTGGRPDILQGMVDNAVERPWGKITPSPTIEVLQSYVESQAPFLAEYFLENPSQSFNEDVGAFLYDAAAGPATTLQPHQCVRLLELLFKARAARGDVPLDQPMLRRNELSTIGWNAALPVPEGL